MKLARGRKGGRSVDTYKGLLRRAQVWIETKQENFDPLVWNEKKV